MVEFLQWIPEVLQIVSYVLYGCIFVHFLDAKDNLERLKIVAVVAAAILIELMSTGSFSGFFYNPRWPFMFTQLIFLSLLALMGRPMLIHKHAVLLMLIIFVAALNSGVGVALVVGWIAYIIVAYGFLISTYKILQHGIGSGGTPRGFAT